MSQTSSPHIARTSPLISKDIAGAHPHEQRYVSRRELRQLFPVSDMTIWRWMRDPVISFPRPVKLGRNGRNFWWYPAIIEWERQRKKVSSSNLEQTV